ncbi:unnamed protein product [Cylindrotheca closterium]|uniref:Crossover junction endonuclease MUS81 n=1 Tax=Cylindrotheca closterium TaxID=2856 RepID=A0AAD2G639_9STRA|nr:unnamed protein product [Cylindrotheca closterium]
MVQLTIQVRAKTCYSNAGKVKTLSIDSSQRVEEIVERGSRLYRDGRELPLNSSFASNNVQNGDILESCSSPLMSALLSAVLKDINDISKVPENERTKEKLEPLMGGAKIDPWSKRWSADSIKNRIISLATMKKVIQRDDRYANKTVPKITTLQELYDHMQTVWNTSGIGHNSMAHVFKPSAKNANGKPSTCWQMMEHKFILAQRIRQACATTGEDWIDAFVKMESSRHDAPASATPSRRPRQRRTTSDATPQQPRRTLATPQSNIRRGGAVAVQCVTANCHQLAEYACLEEGCPFHEELTCTMCFVGNHPAHIRDHPRIPLTDARVKAILKEKNKKGYCPEFQSGPYAILCSLLEASTEQQGGRRELSLPESRLKKLAQKRCRSNLYDRQARGRSAFACIEHLADKQLVRKELIPGREEGRFSLMPEGEAMAQRCLDFQKVTEQVLKDKTVTKIQEPCPRSLTLLVDSREDVTYSSRLQENFSDDGYPCEERELPAGDYLFTRKAVGGSDDSEAVMPLVIERKSWSDFADSVHGAGKGHSRLDCVKVGGTGQCSNGRCQLCRMKRSGCEQVMFIIEGARCLDRDGEDKCSETKRCQHCRELQERHNSIQQDLESIIYDLQATHGCLIHFTRNYNDTIDSLKMIYRLLASGYAGGVQQDDELQRAIQASLGTDSSPSSALVNTPKLTYKDFVSNAKKYKTRPPLQNGTKRKEVKRLGTEAFIRGILEDRLLATLSSGESVSEGRGQKDLNQSFEAAAAGTNAVVELQSSDSEDEDAFPESQNFVEVLGCLPGMGLSNSASKVQCIDIDSDDDGKPAGRPSSSSDDDDIVVVEDNVAVGIRDKRTLGDSSRPGVFVITGLYEYDRDFFKDINKIWQSMYRTQSTASRENFRKGVSEQLLAIQSDQLPLVHRESILYWTLRIPLSERVLIHTARTSQCVNDLTSRWENGRLLPGSGGRTLGARLSPQRKRLAETRSKQTERTPARQQQDDQVVVIDDDLVAATCRRDLFGKGQHSAPDATAQKRTMQKRNQQTNPIYTIDEDGDEITVLHTTAPRAARQKETLLQTSDTGKPPLSGRKAPPVNEIGPATGSGMKRLSASNIENGRASTLSTLGNGSRKQRATPRSQKRSNGSARKAEESRIPPLSTRKRPPEYPLGTASPRKIRPDPSLSSTDTAIREARLRRFGAADATTARPTSEWECTSCTFKNKFGDDQCKICGATAVTNSPIRQRVATLREARAQHSVQPGPYPARKRSGSTPSTWSCRKCTVENPLHLSSCEVCGYDDSSSGANRPETTSSATKMSSKAVKPDTYVSAITSPNQKRRIRCGACGLDGHNRGTATDANCPAYNNPDEVSLRNKKKEAAEKKARDAQEDAKDFEIRKEALETASKRRNQEMQRLLALQQQDEEESRRIRENELKRKKKAAERAAKRARKLGR